MAIAKRARIVPTATNRRTRKPGDVLVTVGLEKPVLEGQVVDTKMAAANDEQPVIAEAQAPKVEAAAKPKTPVIRLTPEQVSANRSAGIKQFQAAGRPTRLEFQELYGRTGDRLTWQQRAKLVGVATADEAASRFRDMLETKRKEATKT